MTRRADASSSLRVYPQTTTGKQSSSLSSVMRRSQQPDDTGQDGCCRRPRWMRKGTRENDDLPGPFSSHAVRSVAMV
eukprot:scaffold1515_cov162-Amphora_coffeaeformis.AAC.10